VLDAKGYKVSPLYDKRNAEQRRLATAAEKAAATTAHGDWVREQTEKRSPFRFRSLLRIKPAAWIEHPTFRGRASRIIRWPRGCGGY